MAKVRYSRDWMLETYVDFYQSKPLLYNALTQTEQTTGLPWFMITYTLLGYHQQVVLGIYGDSHMANSYAKYQPYQPDFFQKTMIEDNVCRLVTEIGSRNSYFV